MATEAKVSFTEAEAGLGFESKGMKPKLWTYDANISCNTAGTEVGFSSLPALHATNRPFFILDGRMSTGQELYRTL